MTYKILTEDTKRVIHCSRICLATIDPNLQLDYPTEVSKGSLPLPGKGDEGKDGHWADNDSTNDYAVDDDNVNKEIGDEKGINENDDNNVEMSTDVADDVDQRSKGYYPGGMALIGVDDIIGEPTYCSQLKMGQECTFGLTTLLPTTKKTLQHPETIRFHVQNGDDTCDKVVL